METNNIKKFSNEQLTEALAELKKKEDELFEGVKVGTISVEAYREIAQQQNEIHKQLALRKGSAEFANMSIEQATEENEELKRIEKELNEIGNIKEGSKEMLG